MSGAADPVARLANARRAILSAAQDRVPAASLAQQARALTLWDGKRLVAMDQAQEAMVYDLAVLDPVGDHLPAIERQARAAPPAEGTPEAMMLAALRAAKFGLFRMLGPHEEGGAELAPLPDGAPIRVFDRFLSQNPPGLLLGARLCGPGGIAMTCGVVARLDAEAIGRLLAGTPPERGPVTPRHPAADDAERLARLLAEPGARARLTTLQQTPGLAARAYRVSLDLGLMGEVPGR